MKKIIIILVYSILSVMFFSILANSKTLSKVYGLWLELYGVTPWFFQYCLIVVGGFVSTKIFAKSGSYHVEFDEETLEKKQQKGMSVLRTSVLLSMLIWIVVHKHLVILGFLFNDVVLIFSLLYLGKLMAYPAYFCIYANRVIGIYNDPALRVRRECKPVKCLLENPINALSEDKFQREPIVSRLKNCLIESPESGTIFRRIALVGFFGSGKSSVLNMLEKLVIKEQEGMKSSEKWLFVHFDAWGRADNTGGVQGVLLESIINTITKVIETSSVQSIPCNYMAALRNIHATTKFLSDLIGGNTTPTEQLGKLNALLKENNFKVCVFIEDMDRNEEPRKAINSIAPLLNDFAGDNHISFIFTLGYDAESSDIVSRVTDYREDLPPIDVKPELISFVESQHRKAYRNKNDLFYEIDVSNWMLKDCRYLSLDGMDSKNIYNVMLLLSDVITTPREFSIIKREIESKWEWLQGEVNFDDLLIVTTLKTIDPIAYDFIFKNINQLQDDHSEELSKKLDGRWKELPVNTNRESSKKLIEYVFSSWAAGSNKVRTQSLYCKFSFKNYWEVYLKSGNVQLIDYSDQKLFDDMRAFDLNKKSETAIFIDRMVGDEEFVKYVRNFWSCRKKVFCNDFWSRILDIMQIKSTSVNSSIMTSSHRELEAGEACNQCEALKLIHSSYIDKKSEQCRLHIAWALNTSIYYFYYLCANSQREFYLKDVFSQAITCDNKFSKLINGKEEGSSLLFECLKLGCVSAEIEDGLEAKTVASSLDVDLYKIILTWVCCLSNTRSKIECYDALFYKGCHISPINASVSRWDEVFDLGVYELLTEDNKLDICNIVDSEDKANRNRLDKVKEKIILEKKLMNK